MKYHNFQDGISLR